MFGLRAPELIIILVVVLIIFGPKNLPKLGAALGSTVKNLREGLGGDKKVESVDDDAEIVESEEDKEIAELEAKLAAAKKKQAEDSDADAE